MTMSNDTKRRNENIEKLTGGFFIVASLRNELVAMNVVLIICHYVFHESPACNDMLFYGVAPTNDNASSYPGWMANASRWPQLDPD